MSIEENKTMQNETAETVETVETTAAPMEEDIEAKEEWKAVERAAEAAEDDDAAPDAPDNEETEADTGAAVEAAAEPADEASEPDVKTTSARAPRAHKPRAAAQKAPAKAAVTAARASNVIESENDLVNVLRPELQREADLEEIKRAIRRKSILSARIFSVEPISGHYGVLISGTRKTLSVVFQDEDFFSYTEMRGLDKTDDKARMDRYQRTARQRFDSCVNFVPLKIGRNDETGVPFVIASRRMAMEAQRERHFFGPNADVAIGTRVPVNVISTGPDYAIVEVLGVETHMGGGQLSAFQYVDDVSRFVHPGDSIDAIVTFLEVDRANDAVRIGVNHAELERRTTSIETLDSVHRGSTHAATVTSVNDRFYTVVLRGIKVEGRVNRADNISGEVLQPGDKVNMIVYGHDFERGYVYGACHKA